MKQLRVFVLPFVFVIVPLRLASENTKEKPPTPMAEIIGQGVISTSDDELGANLTPDGQTLYFEKSAPPHYLYILYESHLLNGNWSVPQVLPFSGQYRDTDPVLCPDGKTLLFASDRPVKGVDHHHFYIWFATKTLMGWTAPELMKGPVNDGFDQVFASMAKNGNVYFTSSRKTGHYDVYRSRLVNNVYENAEDLGPDFNGPTIDSFEAFVAPDESFLLIGSFGREEGLGSSDIYISHNQNGTWTKPRNLGAAVNTPARDYSPRVSGDGKWLLFTSEKLDNTLPTPISYRDFVKFSRGIFNGLGNLYRILMQYVLDSTKPR